MKKGNYAILALFLFVVKDNAFFTLEFLNLYKRATVFSLAVEVTIVF